MISAILIACALAAPAVAVVDSVVYPVYNHERVAGSMVVTTNAETTTVRYVGSIAVGKVADRFIVNGKPAEHVRDLRNVEQVVRGGRLYDASVIEAELSEGNNNR